MLDFGFSEILLTSAIALVVLGPERLPKVARQVGNWMGRARAMARQLSEQLEREVSADELLKAQNKRASIANRLGPPDPQVPLSDTHAALPDIHAPLTDTHAAFPGIHAPMLDGHAASPNPHTPMPNDHAAVLDSQAPMPDTNAALRDIHVPPNPAASLAGAYSVAPDIRAPQPMISTVLATAADDPPAVARTAPDADANKPPNE